jgi:hypothetical protein
VPVLIVDTWYGRVLELVYERHPGLAEGSYDELQPPSLPPRTMTADADTLRRETRGPSNELTKSY